MKKPKPLDLSSCEEMSRDEMRSMVAGTKNDILNLKSGFLDSGYQWVDSGTLLWEASKAACYGKREGDDCYIAYGSGLPAYGKCYYTLDPGSQKVLSCTLNLSHGSGSSGSGGSSGGATWWDEWFNGKYTPQREGCIGKNAGDLCSWKYGDTSFYGNCGFDEVTHYLLCANVSDSRPATSTGALTAREAACLNKKERDKCEFYGEDGILTGYCDVQINFIHKVPLTCLHAEKNSENSNDSSD